MSAVTSIEWTDVVWNPVTGCSKVSAGCRHCYAEAVANRFWGARKFTDVQCHADRLEQPLHWKQPRRIFVNSMSDLFHEDVPDEFIASVYAVMVSGYWHVYQTLTKRPERRKYLLNAPSFREWVEIKAAKRINALRGPHSLNATSNLAAWNRDAAGNIHEGVSIEDQGTADERIPILLQTPAAVRWVSAEPLLGPVDLERGGFALHRAVPSPSGKSWPGLDWVVVGGESGPGARPCDLVWIRSIVGQCKEAGVPCFVKQLGALCKSSMPSKPTNKECREFIDDVRALQGRIDRKGANIEAFPADLRVRQWPR